jgi:hypothetical protein
MPRSCRPILRRPDGLDDRDAERLAYRIRRRATRAAEEAGVELYAASCSFLTVTYKAMADAAQLGDFYPDLADERFVSALAVFHSRFSTNTMPTWQRAQPFRMLCHNGEINTIEGNANLMQAREGQLVARARCRSTGPTGATRRCSLPSSTRTSPTPPSSTRRSSCSSSEGVTSGTRRRCSSRRRGRTATRSRPTCATSTATTPASSSRGTDRPRSSSPTGSASAPRSTATDCARSATTSAPTASSSRPARSVRSASSSPRTDAVTVRRGRLGPGQMLCVDPTVGGLQDDATIKHALAARAPYGGVAARGADRGVDGAARRARRRRPRPPPARLRLHEGGGHLRPAADGDAGEGGGLLDGGRHADRGAVARPPSGVAPAQAALRPGHQPADRPPARARGHEHPHPARSPRADPHRGSGGGAARRARLVPAHPGRAAAPRDGPAAALAGHGRRRDVPGRGG